MEEDYFQDFCKKTNIIDYIYENTAIRIMSKYINKKNNSIPIYRFSLIDKVYKMKSRFITQNIIQEIHKKEIHTGTFGSYNSYLSSYSNLYNTSYSNSYFSSYTSSYNSSYSLSYTSSYNNSYSSFYFKDDYNSKNSFLSFNKFYNSNIGYPLKKYKNIDIIEKLGIDKNYFTTGYGLELI